MYTVQFNSVHCLYTVQFYSVHYTHSVVDILAGEGHKGSKKKTIRGNWPHVDHGHLQLGKIVKPSQTQ